MCSTEVMKNRNKIEVIECMALFCAFGCFVVACFISDILGILYSLGWSFCQLRITFRLGL
jgi:hypothetical protein